MILHRIVSSREVSTGRGPVRCFNEVNIYEEEGIPKPVVVQKNLTPIKLANFDLLPSPEEMIRVTAVCDVDSNSFIEIRLPSDQLWICTKQFAKQNNWIY